MTRIQKTAIVNYSPLQMYDLVNDVEKYSEFLPYCAKSTVLSSASDAMCAKLEFNIKSISYELVTNNTLTEASQIHMQLDQEGIFKSLDGVWQFNPIGNTQNPQCHITLQLEFAFASKLTSIIFAHAFEYTANQLVNTFCERAKAIYA